MENKGNSLAKISLAINIALIIAVIILFVKMPSSGDSSEAIASNDSTVVNTVPIVDDGQLRIGYFMSDSLSTNLLLTKEIETLMADAQKNAESKMAAAERKVQKWQEKWAGGGQLLPNEQKKYAEEAPKIEQDYMRSQQEIQMELGAKQEEFMFTLITRITNSSKVLAEKNGYDYILSYQLGQNIYYGSPNFDVTDELIAIMNADYNDRNVVGSDDSVIPEEGE